MEIRAIRGQIFTQIPFKQKRIKFVPLHFRK